MHFATRFTRFSHQNVVYILFFILVVLFVKRKCFRSMSSSAVNEHSLVRSLFLVKYQAFPICLTRIKKCHFSDTKMHSLILSQNLFTSFQMKRLFEIGLMSIFVKKIMTSFSIKLVPNTSNIQICEKTAPFNHKYKPNANSHSNAYFASIQSPYNLIHGF